MSLSVILLALATSSSEPPHRESMKMESISAYLHPLAISKRSPQLKSDRHPDGACVLTSAISITLPTISISFLARCGWDSFGRAVRKQDTIQAVYCNL